MNKRVSIFLLSCLALSMLVITLVSAAPETNEVISGIQNFFKPLLEAVFGGPTQIFEQLLFALLIIAFVYMALSRVPIISENAFALWTATIVSAILAVRFIATEGLINLLLLPQGAMGVAMLTIIPFIIYFWFVEFGITSKTLRKMAWAVYAAIWVVLWYKQFYGTSKLVIPEGWGYMYLIAVGISIALIYFDGTVQKYRNRMDKEKALTPGKYIQYNRLMKDREAASEAYADLLKRGETAKAIAVKQQMDSIDRAIEQIMH